VRLEPLAPEHDDGLSGRRAIERLGATFEGIHREHRIIPGVGIRDTACYSALDESGLPCATHCAGASRRSIAGGAFALLRRG
jgi:hypothetical protein